MLSRIFRLAFLWIGVSALNLSPTRGADSEHPMPGNAVIAGHFRGSAIEIATASQFAGAIYSVRWRGKEFINNYDHGRQLQSAAHFDGAGPCYNPTEAGSRNDGKGSESTSRLLSLTHELGTLTTRTQMAFWLAPGDQPINCPSGFGVRSHAAISDYILTKKVTIGDAEIPNAIGYEATFTVPRSHRIGIFEVATAYMPIEFSEFWNLDPNTGELTRLSDGPGEQNFPVIFSTKDESYAMGVVGEGLPQLEWPRLGYGRWRFALAKGVGNATVKWNCVYRKRNLDAGNYKFKCFAIIGSLSDVASAMTKLFLSKMDQN